jgi:hypothetical protein
VLPWRRQHPQRRLHADLRLLIHAISHNLGGHEGRLSVRVEGEDVSGNEQEPVDVLVEVGENVVDAAVVLADEPLHLSVQSAESALDKAREEGQGVRGRFAAEGADRGESFLICTGLMITP